MRTNLAQEKVFPRINTPSSKTPPPLSLSDHHLALLITAVIQEGAKRFESKDYITDKLLRLIRENKDTASKWNLPEDYLTIKQTLVDPHYQDQDLLENKDSSADEGYGFPQVRWTTKAVTFRPRPVVPLRTEEVSVPGGKDEIEVPQKKLLPSDFGSRPGEDIQKEFNELEKEMSARLKAYKEEYRLALANIRHPSTRTQVMSYYGDLIKAISKDLLELRLGRRKGSKEDRINLYNRLSYEFHLEVKYNVNLTANGTQWSMEDLEDLEEALVSLPEEFTTLNGRLKTIQIEEQIAGRSGYNTGGGKISIEPGDVDWAIVHEIGHYFDDENPQWKEFLALSGWKDITNKFTNISSDKINGELKPHEGTAKYKKDGKAYKDGDKIDLDGDGRTDGVVQVHYGRVMIHSETAQFYGTEEGDPYKKFYSATNPKDDFAETFKYFFENPNDLKKKCPEKFQFMVNFVGYDPTAQTGKQPPKYV